MTAKIGFYSHGSHHDLPLSASLKNHQRWEVCRTLQGDAEFSVRATDPYGISHAIKDFIVENLDPDFEKAFLTANREEKDKLVYEYLNHRLTTATAFQVHLEKVFDSETKQDHLYLRLGSYGLQGGGRNHGLAFSAAKTGAGIFIVRWCHQSKNRYLEWLGLALMGMGTVSGSYAYFLKSEEEFTWSKYWKNSVNGALSSAVSSLCGYYTQGVGTIRRVAYQTVSSSVGSVLSSLLTYQWDGKTLDRKIAKKVLASGAVGLASSATGEVFNALALQNENFLKAMGLDAAKGTTTSIISKLITRYFETEKQTIILQDLLESLVLGGGISALMTFLKQRDNFKKLRDLHAEKTEKQKNLAEVQEKKAVLEGEAKKLTDLVKQAETDLAMHQEALRLLDHEPASPTQQETKKALELGVNTTQEQLLQRRESLSKIEQESANLNRQISAMIDKFKEVQKTFTSVHHHLSDQLGKITKHLTLHINGRPINTPQDMIDPLLSNETVQWSVDGGSPAGSDIPAMISPLRDLFQMENRLARLETEQGVLSAFLEAPSAATDGLQIPSVQSNSLNSSSLAESQALRSQLTQYISILQVQIAKVRLSLSEAYGEVERVTSAASVLNKEIRNCETQMRGLQDNYIHSVQSNTASWVPKGDQIESGVVEQALSKGGVKFVDCRLRELISHVILVHALNQKFPHWKLALAMDAIKEDREKTVYYLKDMMKPDGTLGSHLEFDRQAFQEGFIDRPQLHWAWNQLVQPNGVLLDSGRPKNCWEEAKIALLEPLSTFEKTTFQKPYAVAPYDTCTLGSHQPTDQSILLVEESIIEEAKKHLIEFRGKIISFKGSLRTAVIDALKVHYPQAWHICDENGNLTGHISKYSSTGYYQHSCIKNFNGQVIALICRGGKDEKDQSSTAFKEYYNDKRYIGLHADEESLVVWLEDNKNFKNLKWFKNDPSFVKRKPATFAGGIQAVKGLETWDVLEALKFYQACQKKDTKTGIGKVAKYVINEAMSADLTSLFYQMNLQVPLMSLDLKMIFNACHDQLVTLLDNIQSAKEAGKQQQAWELFKNYTGLLTQAIQDLIAAKQQTIEKLWQENDEDSVNPSGDVPVPLCLRIAQDVWVQVEVPTQIDFDLGKEDPLPEKLREYANKALRTLPFDIKQLQQLYQDLAGRLKRVQHSDRKSRYQLNIICSLIQWRLQEKIYCNKAGDQGSSILAQKLTKATVWLRHYGLEPKDFSRKVGTSLFDNLAIQLPTGFKTAEQLRQEAVAELAQHVHGEPKITAENWDNHFDQMSLPLNWGPIMIEALAVKLASPIIVLSLQSKPKIYHKLGTNTPLFLHDLGTNHFEACFPFKELQPRDIYEVIKGDPHD